jgi:ZIP family zinc transporter
LGQSLVFGLIASSALVIGGTVGAYWRAPTRLTGVMLAFASGSLISALAFELFSEAVEEGGLLRSALALVMGAAIFVVVNTMLDAKVASARAEQREVVAEAAGRGIGFSLLAAVVLDGIPENTALGVSLTEHASVALLVAIFASNFPESLVGAIAMRDEGRSPRYAIGIWAVAAVVLAAAVVVGRAAAEAIGGDAISVLLALAGGAVLASLADTLMPEAFEHGKPWNSFATTAGFVLSFALAAA